jgi:hypothetical protein
MGLKEHCRKRNDQLSGDYTEVVCPMQAQVRGNSKRRQIFYEPARRKRTGSSRFSSLSDGEPVQKFFSGLPIFYNKGASFPKKNMVKSPLVGFVRVN